MPIIGAWNTESRLNGSIISISSKSFIELAESVRAGEEESSDSELESELSHWSLNSISIDESEFENRSGSGPEVLVEADAISLFVDKEWLDSDAVNQSLESELSLFSAE